MRPVTRCAALLIGLCTLPVETSALDATDLEGLWCHEKNALAVTPTRRGIEFALFSSRNGSFCSAGGLALPAKDGWIHRSEEYGQGCEIRLTATAKGVELTTPDDQAPCRGACGASNEIDGLTFPASARVSRTGNRQQLDAIDQKGLNICLKKR